MLFRSHLRSGRSILGLAESDDGFRFRVRRKPFMQPATEEPFAGYEEFGVEDPRITLIEGSYYITYSAYSRHGVRVALARTRDFEAVERIAPITQADYRNVVLFPRRIGGRYVRLDRPHTEIAPWSIWISYSPDLVHWGESRILIKPLPYHWDEMKIGPGAPPIETPRGMAQHHSRRLPHDGWSDLPARRRASRLEDPRANLGVADSWIVQPEDAWEVTGYVHNVVFTCGAVPEDRMAP